MKSSIQNKQIFNDYAMFIIALIISSISTVLGIISLFIKPNLNVFEGQSKEAKEEITQITEEILEQLGVKNG